MNYKADRQVFVPALAGLALASIIATLFLQFPYTVWTLGVGIVITIAISWIAVTMDKRGAVDMLLQGYDNGTVRISCFSDSEWREVRTVPGYESPKYTESILYVTGRCYVSAQDIERTIHDECEFADQIWEDVLSYIHSHLKSTYGIDASFDVRAMVNVQGESVVQFDAWTADLNYGRP